MRIHILALALVFQWTSSALAENICDRRFAGPANEAGNSPSCSGRFSGYGYCILDMAPSVYFSSKTYEDCEGADGFRSQPCWDRLAARISGYAEQNGFEKAVAACEHGSSEAVVSRCFNSLISHQTPVNDFGKNLAAIRIAMVSERARNALYYHAANRQYPEFPSMQKRVAVCRKITNPGVARDCQNDLHSMEWSEIEMRFRSHQRKISSVGQKMNF
jgi:hypothetical protein